MLDSEVHPESGHSVQSLGGQLSIAIFEESNINPLLPCNRLTGYSPFQGETHQETFLNVSQCDYDFDDEVFDVVSTDAKEFIELLLVHVPK